MEERVQKAREKLQAMNYKLTPQREATLQVLLENEEGHLTAEEVFLLVREKNPDIGLATVYRTLELLSELAVIQKLNFGDGVARYEIRDAMAGHHHHHLICRSCGNVAEIDKDWLGPIEQKVEMDYHFKIQDHRLIFYGICEACQRKQT